MSVTIYSPPYSEVVHLDDMKGHLKVDTDVTDDDALIASQTTAARDVVETSTGSNVTRQRTLLATTFDAAFNRFPFSGFGFSGNTNGSAGYPGPLSHGGAGCHPECSWLGSSHIHLPRTPIVSITSITYVDTEGVTQTLDSTKYSIVDANMGVIALVYGEYWPITRWQPNAVTARFIAGFAAAFTAVAATDVCTVYGRTLTNDDRVQVINSGGALPAGLAPLTTYFVVNASGATFKLSLTSGGSAVDITSTGSGFQFVALDVTPLQTGRAAIKLLTGYWYRNREAVVLAPGMVAVPLPTAVEALVGAIHA